MRFSTLLLLLSGLLTAGITQAQTTEFIFSPDGTGDLSDPLAFNFQNGVRGLSGPYDLDKDGKLEVLLAQHSSAGGRVYVIENSGPDSWELVYSTAVLDSSGSSQNARHAVGTDVDGDGNMEIVYVAGVFSNSDKNPLYKVGAYIWEHDGVEGSDNYGTAPAFIANYYERDGLGDATSARAEHMESADVDGDGRYELLIPSNGPSAQDIAYVIGIVGDIEPNGFDATFATVNIEGRLGPRENGNAFGGGSPNAVTYGDYNGDGAMDISWMVWNNFNVMNQTVAGVDSVIQADTLADNRNLKAAERDDVALFSGFSGDIDGDGNDEAVWINWYDRPDGDGVKDAAILNYDDGDNVLEITDDKLNYATLPLGGAGGGAVSDLDGDGQKEILAGGPGFSSANMNAGESPTFLIIAEFNGGDVGDGANYSVDLVPTPSDADQYGFNTINRDSAGVMETYFETACAKQGSVSTCEDAIFPSGLAYMGDADGDGSEEIAISFQGVDDTLDTVTEFWNGDSLQQQFNTPDGGTDPGAIGPGESYSFEFSQADKSAFFNFATMFVESNDLFFAAADTGIALFNEDGTMRAGDVTGEIMLWDAGTELNEEPFVGPNQAPRQANPGDGLPDTLAGVTLCCEHDEWDYPAVSDVINVALESAGENTFRVVISNVSVAGAQGKTMAVVPLAPGVGAQDGAGTGSIFEEGSTASAGLKMLAEDGNNSVLLAELQADRGYFRTTDSRSAADVRAFLRILSMDGMSVKSEGKIVLPTDYKLSANYPNPFNPTTSFDFTLPLDKQVSVRIYDVMGRLVRTLVNDELRPAGTYKVTWDGRDASGQTAASGNYIYTLEYGNFRQTRSMVLLK